MPAIPGKRRRKSRRKEPLASPPLTMAELDRAVGSVDAPVYLTLSRVLRRTIREHAELTGLQLDVPHGDVYVIGREPLLKIVDFDELGLGTEALPHERVILVERLEEEDLEATPAPVVLTHYWRLIFHGMVHLAAEERMGRGELSASQVRCWISRLGTQEFAEMRDVLQAERRLIGAADARSALIEATAVFWELRYFSPGSLPIWFPAIENPDGVAEVLSEVVEPGALFRASRPDGAPEPNRESSPGGLHVEGLGDSRAETPDRGSSLLGSLPSYRKLVHRAERAAARGNLVQSLILLGRARLRCPKEKAGTLRTAVHDNLESLIHRLLAALKEPSADPDAWYEPLRNLVQSAARGFWNPEARLLYDLQKVCMDREEVLYRVASVDWLVSLGRRPLRRRLAHQQNVLICQHLRSARRRLVSVRLSGAHRRQLDAMLRHASGQAEELVRLEIRPVIFKALKAVGLSPDNLPERVAAQKLVEELVDRIIERGILTMGDLRDAVARNHLKMHDLARPEELVYGDQLLRIDRQLAKALDRVYRRGEFYLRWMQSISSLAFGTPWGRFLTRYLAVPFGGAYLLETGIQHVLHKLTGVGEAGSPLAVILLGVFFLGLLNFEQFRIGFKRLLKHVTRATRFCLIEFPQKMLSIPLVRLILQSKWFRFGYRFLAKPALFTAVIVLTTSWLAGKSLWSPGRLAILFSAVAVAVNTRLGRDMEEIATDWLLQAWRRLGLQFLVALFTWVMDVFGRAVDAVERFLYAVDEWLRFTTAERRSLLAFKAIASPAWSLVRYLIRFCVNLLIEPQINPIKHFPVVTVSHKILLPFIPAMAGVLSLTMDKASAYFAAGTLIALTPGAFGFLVWELQENWRLYRANRPDRLLPVPVGPHGETISRLLKPGFHSGAVPKRFARLRHAKGRVNSKGHWRSVRAHLRTLHEMELCFRRYIERDFVAPLRESAAWPNEPLAVATVRLGTNRIVAELSVNGRTDPGAWLAFDACAEHLLAAFAAPDWLAELTPKQRAAVEVALVGLYKSAGASFVREAIEACLAPEVAAYHFLADRLVLWRGPVCEEELTLELAGGDDPSPGVTGVETTFLRPDRSLKEIGFRTTPVPYQSWVDAWSDLVSSGNRPGDFPASLRVFPDTR